MTTYQVPQFVEDIQQFLIKNDTYGRRYTEKRANGMRRTKWWGWRLSEKRMAKLIAKIEERWPQVTVKVMKCRKINQGYGSWHCSPGLAIYYKEDAQ